MSESINEYKTRKLIYQIMFDFYDDYEENTSIFDLIIIESLKNIVEFHSRNNDLSKDVINNINKFLMQAREYKDEKRKDRIELVNDIIRIMNNQEKDRSLIFYRIQLYDRTNNFKYLFKAKDAEIIDEISNVHDSICNDFFVLVSHTDDVDDITFVNEFLPDLKECELYYQSLNMMLKENPIVFRDQTFYNRMICVLQSNSLLNKDTVDNNEKLVKKINKKIKKLH
ncbi:MAG: hypothetical protein E7174_01025 [Firmicutes bacterium]|nr:hypothetical protein [Bacillota bacterium]